jgi:hypothetical protein
MGKVARGSPLMLCIMQNFSGMSVKTGRTFLATGLYFFVAKMDRSFGKDGMNNGKELQELENGKIESKNAKRD